MVKKQAAATDAATAINEGTEVARASVARPPEVAASTALAPIASGEMFLKLPRELTPPVYGMMRDLARDLAGSGMLPAAIRSPGAALAIMLKAHELGIPPMQGFAHIHIVKGKPTLSAELMLALIFRAFPRAPITFPQLTNDGCEIEAARPGGAPQRFAFTVDDARRAHLLPAKADSAWSTYPRAMCRSRAISEMARSLFPDLIMGCSYTPEELGASVAVNAEGQVEVIDAEVVESTPAKAAAAPKIEIYRATPEQKPILGGYCRANGVSKGDDIKSICADAQAAEVPMSALAEWVASIVHPEPAAEGDGLGKPRAAAK